MATNAYRTMTPNERWLYQRQKERERVEKRQNEDRAVLATAVSRDPCVGCQVPADRHDAAGCRRYIPRRH